MFIRWVVSGVILGFQRRNRAGRIGYCLCILSLFGMFQRILVQAPPGAFGGIPAIAFSIGVLFMLLGWILSLKYPQRRL